jgi:hypothetical protein
MWNGRVVMISFAGLGEAFGEGELSGGEVSVGVGAVLGVGLTADVDGLASGEFEGCTLVSWVQLVNTKTNPAIKVARTTPLLSIL